MDTVGGFIWGYSPFEVASILVWWSILVVHSEGCLPQGFIACVDLILTTVVDQRWRVSKQMCMLLLNWQVLMLVAHVSCSFRLISCMYCCTPMHTICTNVSYAVVINNVYTSRTTSSEAYGESPWKEKSALREDDNVQSCILGSECINIRMYIYIYTWFKLCMYTWDGFSFVDILYYMHTNVENSFCLPISPVITSHFTIAIGDLGRPRGGPDASLCHGTCLAWRHLPSAWADFVGLRLLKMTDSDLANFG